MSRSFADSPTIKATLFKEIVLRVSRKCSDRLRATHTNIGPFVRKIIFEPSQFDSKVSKDTYSQAFKRDPFFSSPDPENRLRESYEAYHLRAVEDEHAEDEVETIWHQSFTSFSHVDSIEIVDTWGQGGRDAERSDLLCFRSLTARSHAFLNDSVGRNTGTRLMRLNLPLLCTPELSVKELSFKNHIETATLPENATFSLNMLKRLEFYMEVSDPPGQMQKSKGESRSKSGPKGAAFRMNLLARLLESSHTSLQELRLGSIRYVCSFQWNDQMFPSHICCTSLRVLRLYSFEITSAQLISALRSNFPNLEQLVFKDNLRVVLDHGSGDGWPVFLAMLKDIPQQKLRVKGTFDRMWYNVPFFFTLGSSYDQALKAYQAKSCNYGTALEVVLRQYIDGLISWEHVWDMTSADIQSQWDDREVHFVFED